MFDAAFCCPSSPCSRCPPPRSAQSPSANAAQADGLLTKTLYKGGASGRYLMGGQWHYRADTAGNGAGPAFAAARPTVGWTPVTVPNAWNAKDYSDASFAGGVGWYRKSFHLPSAAKRTVVGGAVRVGQLPRPGLAQRPADRQEHRRLPAVRAPCPPACSSAAGATAGDLA